jgi:hypothetical protein
MLKAYRYSNYPNIYFLFENYREPAPLVQVTVLVCFKTLACGFGTGNDVRIDTGTNTPYQLNFK